jgi:Zn-finger nucleic acid-binding protein
MQCPTDGTVLQMSERSGIEIDYCPTCRGVWLDRGELDKIIERSLTQPAPQAAPPPQQYGQQGYQQGQQQRGYQQHGYHKPKRKESWLSELFD